MSGKRIDNKEMPGERSPLRMLGLSSALALATAGN